MPNWKKLIVSGSDASLNSLNVTSALTASGFNYPTVDGSDKEVLVTDGSGNLTFERPNTYASVKNKSGGTLLKGTPVHASSSVGNLAEVIAASASVASTMPATFVLNEDLADEASGLAVVTGFLSGVDTSAFNEGDVIYVGENGGYTNVKPTGSSNLIQNLGIVINVDASNGSGFIYGSGRSNDIPNLPTGKVWVGSDEYTTTSAFVHLDETNERFGIATTTPSVDLDVNGTVQINNELRFTNSEMRIFRSTDDMRFRTANNDRVTIDSSGNLGIGTTSPQAKLHVEGDISGSSNITITRSDSTAAVFTLNTDRSAGRPFTITNDGFEPIINAQDVLRIQSDGGDAEIRLDTSGLDFISFKTNSGTEAARIDNNGRLGIGTTSPSYKLEVQGDTFISGNLEIDSGGSNVGVGTDAVDSTTTGIQNTGIGVSALMRNTVGDGNTGMGYQALYHNTIANASVTYTSAQGDNNTAVGRQAMYFNRIGQQNVAIGNTANKDNVSGSNNVAIGNAALENTTNARNNTAVGHKAMQNSADAAAVVAIGQNAGKDVTGTNSTYIGSSAIGSTADSSLTNETAIGYNVTGKGSNTVTIGNSSVTGNYFNGLISGSDVEIDDWGSVSASLASINASSTTPAGTVSSSAQIDHDQTTNFSADEHFTQANITTVGTISTGVWQGTAIDQAYLAGQSGTNTGDEPDASTTVKGVVELATTAETTTGTDTTRAVTPDGLKDGYQGSTNVTTLGTISTGTWQGSAISTTYLQNTSGTNTGDEPDASTTVKGVVELATTAEVTTGTDTTRAVTPDALNDGYQGTANIDTLGTVTSGDVSGILPSGTVSSSAQLTDTFVDLTSEQTITGTKTFTDIVVEGTGSFAVIQSTTGSAKIIGDAYIVLNNDTPSERYAGIVVQDSGSAGVTASLEWDGQTNDWFYEYSDDGGVTAEHGVVIFGPGYNDRGVPVYNANNTILKGTGDHHLADSNITDDGSTITLGSNTTVSGVLSATTFNGMISSSAQVDHDQTTNFNSNEHFTQANITTVGTVTSGDVSAILPSGVVSGSVQVNADTITNFDTNVKAKMNSDAVVSGSATNVRSFLNVEDGADATDFTNVQAAGAVMDSEVTDLDGIKSLTVPNSTTISTFGASLVDDADAAAARTTLGVDAAGTDNSTDVTLVTTSHDYLSLSGQAITLGQIDISDDTNLAASTGITLTGDTLTTNDSEIVHDNLSGFVANEHIDHSGVSITAGDGLSGGGNITATRTLTLNTGSTHFSNGVSASAAAAGFGSGGGSTPTVSVGQYTSTDTTTDVNTASFVIIPFNSTDGVTDTSNYSISSGRVTISEAGTYWVYGHISYDDNGATSPQRGNVALEIFKNGTSLGYRGAMGYLRNSSGHDEASNMVAAYVSVSANDIIDIRGIGIAAIATCNLVSGESVFALNKVGGAVAASNTFADAVTDTGTALDLQYSGGSFYSMGSASSTTAYTTGSTRVGGWAKVFVNASSKPTVAGSTEMDSANSGFTTSTDCYLVVTYDGSNARHFFTTI